MKISQAIVLYCAAMLCASAVTESDDGEGDQEAPHTCVYQLDQASMGDFSNCDFLDPGYHDFRQMTLPSCPTDTNIIQGITPRYADYGEECFSFKFALKLTNESRIIVDYWYHVDETFDGLPNTANIGLLKMEIPVDDVSWALISENLATNSDEWQRVITDPVGDVDVREVRLAVLTLISQAFLYIDTISVTNVAGPCNGLDESPPESAQEEPQRPDQETQSYTSEGCMYDFQDGTMKGLESCIGSWIDEGSKVIRLPSCENKDRFVLTTKSSSLSCTTQTNRYLTMGPGTKIRIRFWYETESVDNNKNYLKLSLFTDTDIQDNDGRDIVQEWRVKPRNQEWQTFTAAVDVNSTQVIEAKVMLDMGMYRDKVFIDYLSIIPVLNPTDCYLDKIPGEHECL